MSTYYYLVCNDCKEIVEGVSKTAGGQSPLGDSVKMLGSFIIEHHGHSVGIIDEHEKFNLNRDGKFTELIALIK